MVEKWRDKICSADPRVVRVVSSPCGVEVVFVVAFVESMTDGWSALFFCREINNCLHYVGRASQQVS